MYMDKIEAISAVIQASGWLFEAGTEDLAHVALTACSKMSSFQQIGRAPEKSGLGQHDALHRGISITFVESWQSALSATT